MDTWVFLAALFLFTMISFLVWAAVSKHRTEERLRDPNAPKSSLAKDGPGPNPVITLNNRGIPPRYQQQ